jgi:hypothetical protein
VTGKVTQLYTKIYSSLGLIGFQALGLCSADGRCCILRSSEEEKCKTYIIMYNVKCIVTCI